MRNLGGEIENVLTLISLCVVQFSIPLTSFGYRSTCIMKPKHRRVERAQGKPVSMFEALSTSSYQWGLLSIRDWEPPLPVYINSTIYFILRIADYPINNQTTIAIPIPKRAPTKASAGECPIISRNSRREFSSNLPSIKPSLKI